MTEPYTIQQELALDESTKHWEDLRDNKHSIMERDADIHTPSPCAIWCECCTQFSNFDANINRPDCEYCPVSLYTGKDQCVNTPYYDARDAWQNNDLPSFKKHAGDMVDFLVKVRNSRGEE